MGRAIEEEIRAGEVVAAIDRRGPDHSPECDRHFMLIGEATDDHLVLQAGLDRAKILIVALDFGS